MGVSIPPYWAKGFRLSTRAQLGRGVKTSDSSALVMGSLLRGVVVHSVSVERYRYGNGVINCQPIYGSLVALPLDYRTACQHLMEGPPRPSK